MGISLRPVIGLVLGMMVLGAGASDTTAQVDRVWSIRTDGVLAVGEFDGAPGLEIMVATSTDIRVLSGSDGSTVDVLDAMWDPAESPAAWVTDFDGNGIQEVLLTLENADLVGLIEHAGSSYTASWTAPVPVGGIWLAQMTGSARSELVVNQYFQSGLLVLDSALGTILYDSTNSIDPSAGILSLDIADFDNDGLDDLLARFSVFPINDVYLITDTGAVAAPGEVGGIRPQRLLSRPNPADGATRLEFSLDRTGPTQVRVFDTTGRQVRLLLDATLSSGAHALPWDGKDDTGRSVAPGVYHFQVDSVTGRAASKMVRLR